MAPKVEVEEKPVELVTYANGAVVPEEPLANKLAKAAHFDVKAATYANFARYAPYQHAAAANFGYNRLFKREAEAEPQYLASPYSYTPYNYGFNSAYNFGYNGYNNAFPYAPRSAFSPYFGYGLNQLAYAAPQVAKVEPVTYTLPKPVTYKIDEEQVTPASTLRYIAKRDAEADAQFVNYNTPYAAATPYTAATPYSGLFNSFAGYPYTGYNGAYSTYAAFNGLNGLNAYPGQYRPYAYSY